jgi:hypothetical protein
MWRNLLNSRKSKIFQRKNLLHGDGWIDGWIDGWMDG